MARGEPELLWAFGDPEPWRRGRTAVVFISVLILFGHAAAATMTLLEGEIETFLAIVVIACLVSVLLFLIWIGKNWARWILAPFFLLFGCYCAVWGLHWGGMGGAFVLGVGALIAFCYLTLSPAVYDFARRQRERIGLFEIIVVGAIFLLLFSAVGGGLFGFKLYQNDLEREALQFAELTFHRVFINKDPHFLEDHASAGRKYSRPQEFINLVETLGQPLSVGPFASQFRFKLKDRSLRLAGVVKTRGLFEGDDGVWIKIEVSGTRGNWLVDHISWDY